MWTCCPLGDKPKPSQMHTRACKLKFHPGLRHSKVIFKSKWHTLPNKPQALAFILLLQLNTCGQNFKVARAARSNPFSIKWISSLTMSNVKRAQKEKEINTGFLGLIQAFNTHLGMIPNDEQLWSPTLPPTSLSITPPALKSLQDSFLPILGASFAKSYPAFPTTYSLGPA